MKINSAANALALAALCCLPAQPPATGATLSHARRGDATPTTGARPASPTLPQPPPPPQQSPAPQTAMPQVDQWGDEFNGSALDESKWERYTFEGGGGGKLEVSGGQLRLRSASKTRAGVRTKQSFNADHFSVEAVVAKVGPQLPEAGDRSSDLGFAALTLLFDGAGRNRVEWIFTSEHTLEAWSVVDGVAERLDNRKLALKFDNPVLAVVRRGDDFLFVINKPDGAPQDAQIALQKTIKNLPRTFRVMLYGFGSSQDEWDSVRVVTAKQ
ncbi:MAG: hypothetical protein LC746_17915 [Acidobacteria bacterium]|nr:hypothetical protein [Acidobacteriota bacterium]